MTPEGKVKQQIKEELKRRGCWYFMPVSNGMGRHGIPDLIACYPTTITQDMVGQKIGVFVGIEAKAPGKLKNVSELQKRNIAEINEAGGVAFAADSIVDLEFNLPRPINMDEDV
ncbi:MAG: VRR-NUC domain-containing protein [Eggerthellaceae bacterium]